MVRSFAELLNLCSLGKATVHADSREVRPGGIFVATRGEKVNGADFAIQAVANGAEYIVGSPADIVAIARAINAGACKFVPHADPVEALWQLACASNHTGELPLKIIGVTGTNGKTTTAFLLESLLTALGYETGVLGTVNYRWPGHKEDASLTTPDAIRLNSMLAAMAEAGAQWAIMEVSSHALAKKRVGGIPFAGAIFTNLTQDHLDFHHDFESYFQAKASLFLELPEKDKPVAINSDDPYGQRLLGLLPDAISYGLENYSSEHRHLQGSILEASARGMHLQMRYGDRIWEIFTSLVGKFNALNLLACQAMALGLGFDPDQFGALENFHGVCGRLERIKNERGLNVFVDYAHTPDALTNVLQALRNAGFKRVITVFGCGGNRDRAKRPLMGKAVAELSDIAILTSDNPRFEDPEAILQDVLPGLEKAAKVIVEVDRAAATKIAIDLLEPEDALLIAGKGHEDYQLVQGQKLHYSDQETAAELLK